MKNRYFAGWIGLVLGFTCVFLVGQVQEIRRAGGAGSLPTLPQLTNIVQATGSSSDVWHGDASWGPVPAAGITALTNDVTASGSGSVGATLANVGTAGTYGDAGHFPVVTTDAKGRVMVVTTNALPAGGIATNLFFNIKDFGAKGDGVTDDWLSISNTFAALPASGGTVYLPGGNYLMSAGLTISKPVTILGSGAGVDRIASNTPPTAASLITFTNGSSYGFTIVTNTATFKNFGLYFTNITAPSSGALITVSTNGGGARGVVRFVLDNISTDGGYYGIDIHAGDAWVIHGCCVYRWSGLDGIRINNDSEPDSGDWQISDTVIQNITYYVRSGIRLESSAGGKIINSKINSFGYVGLADGMMTNAIDIYTTGNSGIILVSNCSIEGFKENGIYSTGVGGKVFVELIVTSCQFGVYNNSPSTAIPIHCIGGFGNRCVISDIVVSGYTSTLAAPIVLRGLANASIGPVEWSRPGVSPVDSDNPVGPAIVGTTATLSTSLATPTITLNGADLATLLTNKVLKVGDTVTGAILSTSASTNAPAENELVTKYYVTHLSIGGTNYHVAPGANVTIATNESGSDITWTITATSSGGGTVGTLINTTTTTANALVKFTGTDTTNTLPSVAVESGGVLSVPSLRVGSMGISARSILTEVGGVITLDLSLTNRYWSCSPTGNVQVLLANATAGSWGNVLLRWPGTNCMFTFGHVPAGSLTNWLAGAPSTNATAGTLGMLSFYPIDSTTNSTLGAYTATQ